MLELRNIKKVYDTNGNRVEALKGISVAFRDNEFVSILGQSGCGKTTLLNIIGGLDHYTSGNLVINGIPTKEYKDHDWDIYRNNTIGFVFQSYNLISHQTVLSNVELSLTLSGVSKEERKRRAIEALKKVGLEDHINKKPNQLSGGQMQRVAIARAIVNNPKIVLADEPTGALDTQTSIQIMNILKDIAKDRLVIMVTHNPELAQQYSTRIINLVDGKVVNDTDPVNKQEIRDSYFAYSSYKKRKKVGMKFTTALGLSFRNLMTKKGRTLLTGFAGSIGIIGIALILSLSSGFQNYINSVEEQTLSSYPLSISGNSVDLSGFTSLMESISNESKEIEDGYVYTNDILGKIVNSYEVTTNDLKSFKTYIEENKDELSEYCNDIQYRYDVDLNLFDDECSGASDLQPLYPFSFSNSSMIYAVSKGMKTTDLMAMQMMINSIEVYSHLMDNDEYNNNQYDMLSGHWPTEANELILITDENHSVNDYLMYAMGYKSTTQMIDDIIAAADEENTVNNKISFDDIVGTKVKLIAQCDMFEKNGEYYAQHTNKDADYSTYISSIFEDKGIELKIVGIASPKKGSVRSSLAGQIGYTSALEEMIVDYINNSDPVKAQKADETKSILNGATIPEGNLGETILKSTYSSLGVCDIDSPDSIYFYANSFDGKERIKDFIKTYNESVAEDKQIKYSDVVGVLMGSISTIIDAISYVLIAFVSISLIVSSIMISVITNISVLERTKEIGVLRSIGASKKDIRRVFNAETFFLGLIAGLLGIGITTLLNIPINILLKQLADLDGIAKLPTFGAIGLVVISVILTLVAGLIPASKAAKQDPVVALRTE